LREHDRGFPTGSATPAQRPPLFATWLLFVGIVLPANLTFFIGEAKFNAERVVIFLLLLWAPFVLLRKGRRLVSSDLFACAASAWIIGAAVLNGRSYSFSSSAALVFEFLGGYMLGRAYFFGRPALEKFVQVLKIAVVVVIAVAVLDHLSGKLVVNDFLRLNSEPEFRYGTMRAASIFPHAILYGTFCAVAGSIFLFSERNRASQVRYVGLCFFGCVLAMSSAPLLVFCVAISVYVYDYMARRHSWRWKVLAAIIGGLLLAVFVLTNNPTSWLIEHLTLDPSTGYFRKATWDRAFYNISLSPLIGYGFDEIGIEDAREFFDNASVDCVWLVLAIRFGIPIMVLLVLTNVTSFLVLGRKNGGRTDVPYMDRMRTGFTLAVVTFMLIGLTVHFWNTIWMFWGVCIGIRASLNEQYFDSIGLSGARSAPSRLHAHGQAQAG
jgi:hypothetical protein